QAHSLFSGRREGGSQPEEQDDREITARHEAQTYRSPPLCLAKESPQHSVPLGEALTADSTSTQLVALTGTSRRKRAWEVEARWTRTVGSRSGAFGRWQFPKHSLLLFFANVRLELRGFRQLFFRVTRSSCFQIGLPKL